MPTMTTRQAGSGARSEATLADFAVIAGALRRGFQASGLRLNRLEKRSGWYAGVISAWLVGRTALPVDRFFDLLAAINVGTHEFFVATYPTAKVPERPLNRRFKDETVDSNLGACLRLHLHQEIRFRGHQQIDIERKVGWTPRYLSTLLANRRTLTLLHCLAVVRAIDLSPAEFFLSLECEPDTGERKKAPWKRAAQEMSRIEARRRREAPRAPSQEG